MGIEIINELFYLFKYEIQCEFYIYKTAQYKLVTFRMLSRHMWLMAILLDHVGLESISGRSQHN